MPAGSLNGRAAPSSGARPLSVTPHQGTSAEERLGLGPTGRALSHFETWPRSVFYVPLGLYWLWQGLRHRSLTLPAIANPKMNYGGMCGWSKSQEMGAMGPEGQPWMAPFTSFVRDGAGDPARSIAAARAAIAQAGLAFPMVAKPDAGCNGTGVRVVKDEEDLQAYIEAFPIRERIILQHLIPYENEAGIFYVRHPDEAEGRIFSMAMKFAPSVVGDGVSTLETLIRRDPRAGKVPHYYMERHKARLDTVPAKDERIELLFARNHCIGAVFRDARHMVTPALTARINQIAESIPDFYFGRFDIRFESVEKLQAGEGLSIVEFNGGGSEAIHIWDADMSLGSAYRDLFEQLRLLFSIGAAHRRAGHRPPGPREFLRRWRHQRELKPLYPPTQ